MIKLLKQLLRPWRGERRVPVQVEERFGGRMSLGELEGALRGCGGDPVARALVHLLLMQRAVCLDEAEALALAGLHERAAAQLGASRAMWDVLHEVLLAEGGGEMGAQVKGWFGNGEG